jgi:amino acid adenylation domain-containing protein
MTVSNHTSGSTTTWSGMFGKGLGDAEPAPSGSEPSRRLSLSQERLWLVSSLLPEAPPLNEAIGAVLSGPIDLRMLEEALARLVARHEILRTSFRTTAEGPERIVSPRVEVPFAITELSGEPDAGDRAVWLRCVAPALRAPLPVDRPPLLRAGVLRVRPDLHVLYVVVSRLICDGASRALFLRELSDTYAAMVLGGPPPPPPALQYADWVEWHREWLAGSAALEALAYWERTLSGAETTLELPFDHPRPARLSYRGAVYSFEVPAPLAGKLRALARAQGVTLQQVVLAAFEVLIHRYVGQTDFVVGVPVEARLHSDAESLIGPFRNTRILRARVSPERSFLALLGDVHASFREAHPHRHTPFEQLVEALRPPRDPSRTPLFQVAFDYEDAQEHDGPRGMGPLRVEPLDLHCGNTVTDLTCTFRDDGYGLTGGLEYATELFEPATIERLSAALLDLFDALVEHPERPLRELPLSTRHAQTLDAWNATEAAYDRSRLVHRLFEARVDEAPHRTAILFEDESVSYAELDQRASKIARHLRGLGVGPEDRVGVCLRRSVDLVATLIGVHKAGGCYVPLDPTYPPARLEMMLEDAGARVLVVNTGTRGVLAATGVQTVDLDADADAIARAPGERFVHDESASQLAYVIYTSGSTGRPKGVLVEHRNVVNFFRGMEEVVRFDPDAVWLAGTSVSFDISVLELFGSLSHGLTVVLLGEQRLGVTAHEAHSIPQCIERHRVTHFQCTPSQAALLLADPAARVALGRLRQLLVGGEALPAALAHELGELLTHGELVNMYGPTETTVWSTAHGVTDEAGPVPIGRPLANTYCYVMDAEGRRLPIGAVGELFIGGDGVVRGYHERADLTDQRFVPDPFRGGGHRMYRTGDLVRFRPDGRLEYRGRNDFQVKIRGHRIELGEIEALLEEQPSVGGAAVAAVEDGPGDARLVAYVVASQGAEVAPEGLRDALKARLPAYMVPALVIPLEDFPLTPNGKIDRKALPRPTPPAPAAAESRGAPIADETERVIAGIWADALGVPAVGTEEDFFDLGGYSLLGVRILTRIHETYGVRLSLSVLFDAPTVRALAEIVRRDVRGASGGASVPRAWSSVVPIQPRGTLPPFFCVAGMGGNPMNLRHVAAALGTEQPFLGLQHRGVDGTLEPHRTIEDMAREFVEHIRQVQPDGPYDLGGFSGGGVVAFEMAQQLVRAGQEVRALVLLEAVHPQLGWSFAGRLGYHLGQLRAEGASYFWKAMEARARRQWERLQIAWRARAAKVDRYEFRNEAVMQAWIEAARRYHPSPYGGEVTLLRAKIRDSVVFDRHNGWRPAVTGTLNVIDVEGGHVSFVDVPYAAETARELRCVLARARAGAASSAYGEAPPRPAGNEAWTLAG